MADSATKDGGRGLRTKDLQEALRALSGEDGKGDVVWLGMGNARIGDEGAKAIGEALKSNGTLTKLVLERNKIGAEGAKAIGEALKSNETLTSLDLYGNEIGDEGVKAIGEALKSNGTLTWLNLAINEIGDEGAKAIGEALKSNGTLNSLGLLGNGIGDEGAKAIAEALKVNGTLARLYLERNQIADEGAIALFCSLEHRGSHVSDDGSELDWDLDTKVPATSTSLKTPTSALEMIKRLIENGKGNFALNISNRFGTVDLIAFAKGWHQLKQNGISDLTMPPEAVIRKGSKNIDSFFNELSSGDKSQTKTQTQSKAQPQSKSQATSKSSKHSPLPPTGKKSEQPKRREAEKKAQEESNTSSRAKAVTEAERGAHIKRLREIHERNLSKTLNAIKCMVLGEGRCGKSTSIGAFLGEPFDPNKRSTEGMDQEKCTIDVHAGRTGTGAGAGQHWKKSKLDTSAMHERHLWNVAMDKNAVPVDELRKRNFPPAEPKKKERRGSFLGFNNKPNSKSSSGIAGSPAPSGTSQGGEARLPGPPPSSMSSSSGSSDKSERDRGKGKEYRQDDQPRSRRSSFGEKLKGYLPSSSKPSTSSASQQATPATPSEESATRRAKESADEDEYIEKYLGKLSIPASSSNGISIEQQDGEIEILLWDLGGQEVFHHLHQLYMTEYGFYMLVFNMERLAPSTCGSEEARKEALANIEFWLNTIAIQASCAKMFFLGTHLDTVPNVEDHRAIDQLLRSTFNIETNDQVVYNSESELSFWPIDNTGGSPHRTNAIRKKVEVVIQELPFLKDFKIPVNWMRTLDELKQTWNSGEQTQSQSQVISQKQSQNRPYVHMQELCAMAAKCGVTNPDDIRDMLYWYNELGLTLHFPEGVALRDIVVLDPQWLVDAFSKLIRDPLLHIHSEDIVDDEFKRKHGRALAKLKTECIATDELIEALWTNLAPTVELRRFLKGVMINTGLGAVVNFYDDGAESDDDEDSPSQASVAHDDLTANIDGPLFVPSIAPTREDLFAQLDREGSNRWREITTSTNRLSMKVRFHNSLASAIFGRLVAVAIGTSVKHSQMNKAPCDFPQVSQSTATLSLGERKFAIELDDSNPYVLRITVAEAADARIIKDDLLSMIERINVEFMRGNLRYDVLLVIDSMDPEDSILYTRAKKAFKNVTSLESASSAKGRTERKGVGTNISCLSSWFLDVPEPTTFGEETVPQFGHDEMGPPARAPFQPHKYHLFLSHAQIDGGDQVNLLQSIMSQAGLKCWYDMTEGEKVTEPGMREGIEQSEGFLLFLSKSVFERPAVQYEIKQALELNKPIALVHETDLRKPGYCDIDQLSKEATAEFKSIVQMLFKEHRSIPYQRERYLAKAMVGEIRRRFRIA